MTERICISITAWTALTSLTFGPRPLVLSSRPHNTDSEALALHREGSQALYAIY